MTDVIALLRRALRLVDPRIVRRLGVVAIVGILIAALDFLGIILLVPFLSYLGPTASATGFGSGIVTEILGAQSQERVVVILAAAATVLFVLRGIGSVLLLWVQNGLVIQAQLDVSKKVLAGFIGAPWLEQQTVGSGQVLRTARDSSMGVGQMINCGVSAVAEIAIALAVFAALMFVSLPLAIGAFIYLCAAGLIYLRLIRLPIERRSESVQVESTKMNAALIELVGGIRELTIRGTTAAFFSRYIVAATRYLYAGRFIMVANLALRHLLETLLIGGAALVIVVATLSGSTTVLVSIGVLMAGGLRLVPALNMLLVDVNNVRAQEWSVVVVEAELERFGDSTETVPSGSMEPAATFSGAFRFDDVSFSYPTRDAAALRDVDLDVRFGETIGVVGESGAGKSTFVDLLLGFLEPDDGSITVDGRDLREHLAAWRSIIGFVPQDIFLVDDTLTANIAFGEAEATIDAKRIAEAISLAQLDDVIAELPNGPETLVGERGVMLSGGQRQRVGLARALYRRPRVLLLDEATSALDNETERRISDSLQSLHGEMTMVVIAHRLSTVRSCDRIIYLEEGRIAGVGTFDELRITCQGFARLVELGSLEGTI
jgi:ABC-type multidrug transport system fused ATPase/permease subunit